MYECCSIIAIGSVVLGLCLLRSVQAENGNHLIISPFLIFCACETLMAWPAVVLARLQGISTDSHAAMIVVFSTVACALGYCGVRSIIRWAGSPFRFRVRPMEMCDDRGHAIAAVACAMLFVSAGLYLYQGMPPAITGLQQSLSSPSESGVAEMVKAKRLDLTKGHYFGGTYRGQGVVRAIMRIGWPYLTAVALVMFLRRRRFFWGFTFAALLAATAVFVAGDGTRGAFLWGVVGLLVTASYQAKLRFRTCVAFAVVLLGAYVALSLPQKLFRAAERGALWTEGAQQLIDRVFVGNGIHTIQSIEFVRSGDIELRLGAIHANDMAAALPFVNSGTPFVYELFLLENPDASVRQTTFANTTYLGIVYAEFGWVGCLGSYFALGAIIAWATWATFSLKKTTTNIACAGMIALYVGQVSLSGTVYCVVSLGVLFLITTFHRCLVTLYSHPRRMALDAGGGVATFPSAVPENQHWT